MSVATVTDTALTVPQLLLKAAAGLGTWFHESELVVAAWGLDRQRFGLRRMEQQYPDCNRVRAGLCHKRGPVAQGYLERVGELTYTLTRRGRKAAAELGAANGPAARAPLPRITIPADLDDYLVRCAESAAYRKWLGGGVDRVTPAEVLAFLGCGAGDRGEPVRFAVRQFQALLTEAADYAGRPLSTGECVDDRMLGRLRTALAEMLARHGRRLGADG